MPAVGSYRLLRQSPTEALYTNVASTLDQPNTVRHGVSTIADVFKNTGVIPDSGQRVQGLSILSQVVETWKVYDNADNAVDPYYLPVSAHFVLKFPVDALITSTILANFILRMQGSIWAGASDTLAASIDPLLRGVTQIR